MRTRTAISILTLVAFLPLAAGCSASHTSYIRDDPVSDETTSKLAAGDEIAISGYTTRTDGYRHWIGSVSQVGPDSLEFLPRDAGIQLRRDPDEPGLRLARSDVISLEVQTTNGVATAALLVGSAAIVLVILLARDLSEAFDQDNWFQGTR